MTLIDLSNADEAAKRKLLPNSVYEATVQSVEHGVGKSSGEQYFKWTLKVVDNDYPNPAAIYYYTSFSEAAQGNGSIQNIERMAGMKLPRTLFDPETWLMEHRDQLERRTVTIQVKTEEQAGYEPRNAVAAVRMPLPTGEASAATPAPSGKSRAKTNALFE